MYRSVKIAVFTLPRKKKSFVWKKENNPVSEYSSRLTFKELKETGDQEFIIAIEKVTNGTLDRDDLDYPNWWKLGYTSENEFVGLIVPQGFTEKTGAINYIGVDPGKRGKGYVHHLLSEGVRVLIENGVEKIIADIDVNNHPLDKALSEHGFKKDCSMLVLKKR